MKLDQIPKKNLLNAPEGYFDTLPGIVQSRIEPERHVRQSPVYFRFALRYALPVLVLLAAGMFWFRSEHAAHVEFETELAAIDAQNLELYLESSDVHADDVLEPVNPMAIGWSPEELEELENSIYASYDLPNAGAHEILDVY